MRQRVRCRWATKEPIKGALSVLCVIYSILLQDIIRQFISVIKLLFSKSSQNIWLKSHFFFSALSEQIFTNFTVPHTPSPLQSWTFRRPASKVSRLNHTLHSTLHALHSTSPPRFKGPSLQDIINPPSSTFTGLPLYKAPSAATTTSLTKEEHSQREV